jgi:uncharacterized protein YndB with AHSA1/START domain
MSSPTDRIERNILLKAPRAHIWRALSNAEEFGNWFGVALQGKSFKAGERVRGHVTYRGYETCDFRHVDRTHGTRDLVIMALASGGG